MIVRSNVVNRSFIVHHDSLVPPACGFQRVRITDRSHWPENNDGGGVQRQRFHLNASFVPQ
jgi:hypothetical protein